MTLYDIIKRNSSTDMVDYTFLYNPDFDYEPVTKEKLIEKSWNKVGKKIQDAMGSL